MEHAPPTEASTQPPTLDGRAHGRCSAMRALSSLSDARLAASLPRANDPNLCKEIGSIQHLLQVPQVSCFHLAARFFRFTFAFSFLVRSACMMASLSGVKYLNHCFATGSRPNSVKA